MKLIEAEIVNFRSIKKASIAFEPSCRVLVGINESGKSNVLRALSFLGSDVDPDRKEDLREPLPNESEPSEAFVEFQHRLEKSESEAVHKAIAGKVLARATDPEIVKIDGKRASLKALCNHHTSILYLADILEEKKGFLYTAFDDAIQLIGTWKKPTDDVPDDYVVEHGDREIKLAEVSLVRSKDFRLIPAEYLEEADLEDLETLLGTAMVEVAEKAALSALFWEYDEDQLLPTHVSISAFAANPETCLPLWNMFRLAGVDDLEGEITRVLQQSNNRIQNFFSRIASKTTAHFRSIWKDYRNIEFQLRVEGDKLIPAVKEQNSFDFAKRSDGFKRFVTFLLMISADVRTERLGDALLLIDEPDTSLHPSGARYLRDELLRISQSNNVVYSTHSIFMIDPGNIDRHYIVTKTREVTTVAAAEPSTVVDEEVLYNAVGHSIFHSLRANNVIFEGWNDKRLFMIALEGAAPDLKKTFRDVGLCHANGAKHIKTITPMMELAKRQCLIISDADAPAREQQKLYIEAKGFGSWKTYEDLRSSLRALTGEDFIANSFLAERLNAVIKGLNLPKFAAGDLPADRDKLKTLRGWLKWQGLTDQQVSDVVLRTKRETFARLESQHIDSSYEKFMRALAAALLKARSNSRGIGLVVA